MKPLNGNGQLLPYQEWSDLVKSGMLTDYDGFGNWATATHYEDTYDQMRIIKPSDFGCCLSKPEWATHVLWYNK